MLVLQKILWSSEAKSKIAIPIIVTAIAVTRILSRHVNILMICPTAIYSHHLAMQLCTIPKMWLFLWYTTATKIIIILLLCMDYLVTVSILLVLSPDKHHDGMDYSYSVWNLIMVVTSDSEVDIPCMCR